MATRLCFVLALLLAACSSGVSGSGSRTAQTTAAPTLSSPPAAVTPSGSGGGQAPHAIFVSWLGTSSSPNGNYTLTLVSVGGKVEAQTNARNRRYTCGPLVPLPNVSASPSRVYFLDGDSTLKYVAPSGETGTVRDLVVGPNQEAVFAVSPDERRIAVVILDHLQYPVTTRLYVEDLTTGSNHQELFSGTVLEWPVAWYQGKLVIAVGINAQPQNCTNSFSHATLGYHIVDASNGNRIKAVCEGWTSYYPPVAAGTLCINGAAPMGQAPSKVDSWDGTSRALALVGGCPRNGALSPDGKWIASNQVKAGDNGCTGQASVYLLAVDGRTVQTAAVGSPEGWLDISHLVVGGEGESAAPTILDVSANSTKQLSVLGFFAGTLPSGF